MVDTLPASGGAGDELSWHELLRTPLSLTASDPPSGHLDARSLVRLVDKRCRADFRHLQAQAQAASEELAARRRESLASIATLAQRWPLPPPGLGAFTLSAGAGEARRAQAATVGDLEALSARVSEAAESVRRSASASSLGRTLARGWAGDAAPWDVFRNLDTRLRSLEQSWAREEPEKPRKAPPSLTPKRRVPKPAAAAEPLVRAVDLPAALPPLSFSPEGVHAALSTLQRAVEKHVQPVDAFVNDFLRARASPLALRGPGEASVEEAGSAGAVAGAPVAPLPPPLPPWYALAPVLPRLHWDSGAASDGLATLLRRRRRLAAERAEWPDGRPLRDPGRRIAIVTTASLPWLTGTSVNPLLRAAYLARDGQRAVTLLLPWLAPSDQAAVHPSRTFSSPDEQAAFVREWVAERVGFAPDLKLTFYPGRWAPDKRSILPVGDITRYVPDAEADVAVLEEPEHLTWYHHGVRWTDKFAHVVGVVHTNYLEYARREEHGAVKEAVLRFVNSWVVRAYCHSVVKLSDAVQPLPRESTCFVHGVSPRFLAIGEERARRAAAAAATSAPAPTQLGMPVAHSDSLAPVTAAAAASGAEPEPAAAGVRDVRTSFSVSASASSPPAPARVSSDAPRLRRTSSAAAAQRSPRGSVDGPGAGGGGEAAQGAPAAAAAPQPQPQQQQQPQQPPAPPAASPDGSPPPPPGAPDDGCGVYFIGKVVWGKGYTELLNLVEAHAAASPPSSHPLRVDVFGGGDDLGEVEAAAAAKHLPLTFRGPRDHADPALHAYRVFVNPSLSDVVATTTAEALAMGKWVVVARHPSNAFFESHFRNCLVYDTPEGFSAQLRVALSKEPAPLSASERDALSWEAATERFMDAAAPVGRAGGGGRGKWAEGVADWAAAQLHQTLTGVEPLRGLAGAGPNTAADPPSLADWRPPAWTGGALDRKE